MSIKFVFKCTAFNNFLLTNLGIISFSKDIFLFHNL